MQYTHRLPDTEDRIYKRIAALEKRVAAFQVEIGNEIRNIRRIVPGAVDEKHWRRQMTPRIGIRIRRFREEQDLSQVQLAKKLRMEPSHLCNIENGKVKPTCRTLTKIALVLGKTLADFDVAA